MAILYAAISPPDFLWISCSFSTVRLLQHQCTLGSIFFLNSYDHLQIWLHLAVTFLALWEWEFKWMGANQNNDHSLCRNFSPRFSLNLLLFFHCCLTTAVHIGVKVFFSNSYQIQVDCQIISFFTGIWNYNRTFSIQVNPQKILSSYFGSIDGKMKNLAKKQTEARK